MKSAVAQDREAARETNRGSAAVFTPADTTAVEYARDLGDPGQFPYTRGIHASGYAGKLWTMRQFAGFGSPEDTNERYHYLLSHGQTGLSVAFDLQTTLDSQVRLSSTT